MRADLDGRGLDVLRHRAQSDPRAATRDAALRFDAVLTGMMVRSMRDAVPRSADASPATDTFTAMLDAQFAQQFAGRAGGLADLLEKQLARHLPRTDEVAPKAEAPPRASFPPAASVNAAAAAPLSAVPAGRAADFIRRMLPHAKEAEAQTGVPAAYILGQAGLESGWGRHEIRNVDGSGSFNLFGIKATPGWTGRRAEAMTTEYDGGEPVRQRAGFRSYGSYAEGFADYARMLASQPRYAAVLREARSAEAFAGGMQRAGYATDPQYANKLSRTIRQAMAVEQGLSA